MLTTGPKISSRAMRMSSFTSANTVGSTKNPRASLGSAGRFPPYARRAPPSSPSLTLVLVFLDWPGSGGPLAAVREARPAFEPELDVAHRLVELRAAREAADLAVALRRHTDLE